MIKQIVLYPLHLSVTEYMSETVFLLSANTIRLPCKNSFKGSLYVSIWNSVKKELQK